MYLDSATPQQLTTWQDELTQHLNALQAENLQLDITRGKPSAEQLSLSDSLDGILAENYRAADGTDVRNYGGLDGLPEAKGLGAALLDVKPDSVLVGGNSSLSLMFLAAQTGVQYGFDGKDSAWLNKPGKFICPVPGYDRHYGVCETLGIEMVTVPMLASGPDMDAVEGLIKNDPNIVGMWCVPKYSNPTGVIYSDETVQRIAGLGKLASSQFRVFWDNAYAVHDLNDSPEKLASIAQACADHGTEDSVIQFASTSKITHAGSGISFISASQKNLAAIKKVLAMMTIGPDKTNQLRHCKLLPDSDAITAHMQKHANIVKPRFDVVLTRLQNELGDSDLGNWETPDGGYFISFDARPNCAKAIVALAAETGVKLTPAGATFPYGQDPEDKNIRIAPTVPTVEELAKAMDVFITCVKLISVQQKIASL